VAQGAAALSALPITRQGTSAKLPSVMRAFSPIRW